MTEPNRFQKLVMDAKTRIKEISPADVAEEAKSGKPVIIDVRDGDETAAGKIPEAKNVSRGTLEIEIEEIAPDLATSIICYCGGGGRSALAAESLQRMGYTDVRSIGGGFKAWQAAGLPVAK